MFYCWSLKKMTLPTGEISISICECVCVFVMQRQVEKRRKKCEQSNDADDDGFVRCVLNVD